VLGTRHKATVGLSEESDAVVVVVSEETHSIGLAYQGQLYRGLDPEALKAELLRILRPVGETLIIREVS
jgi:diadenylate cyclase